MLKWLKLIYSRYLFSAIVILLEFLILLVTFLVIFKIYDFYSPFLVIAYVLYILVLLYIINKYEIPEFKIPWIIIVLIFPIIGAFIYVIISLNKDKDDKIKKFKKNKKKLLLNIKKNKNLEEIKKENVDAYLQAKYICDASKMPCYKNSKATYFDSGESFNKELVESLKKAQKYIFMEYFKIEEGKMWNPIYEILKEKAKLGIKVYVIYDDFGCMQTLKDNYYKILRKEGINCIPSNKFRPVLSSFHNNRDHRKITVIDGIVGFTGGANIADKYINEINLYGHWKDAAVKIEGEAVTNFVILFLEMWNILNKKQLDYKDFIVKNFDNYNDGFLIPYGSGPERFYEESIGKDVYLNMINAAKKYIYISTPYLICDYELLNSLSLAAKKGIDVRVIVPKIPDNKLAMIMTKYNTEILANNGVKMYEYTRGFIHAKNFVCDDIYATCGSINLDYRSLIHHFECGLWMYNTKCIKNIVKDFKKVINESEELTIEKAKVKGLYKFLAELIKVISPYL